MSLVTDTSIPSAEAGDAALVLRACESVAKGFQACRVFEGSDIASGFELLGPSGWPIKGGELTVLFKDIEKTYPIESLVTEVPFADFFGPGKWSQKDHNGELTLLAKIRYEDDNGLEHEIRAVGFVRLFVLKQGYSFMPFDSGFQAWSGSVKCEFQYSTSGRSALKCSK